MNPVGEGSDILLCAMTVVRREIDFGRSSKTGHFAGPHPPHHQWGQLLDGMCGCTDRYVCEVKKSAGI